MSFLDWEDRPVETGLGVVLGVLADSPEEPRQVRLLDADGEERARLTGVLTYEDCDGFSRLSANEGGGLSASLTIPLDPSTRCTTESDGTMTCTLPSGATWSTTPLVEDDESGEWIRMKGGCQAR